MFDFFKKMFFLKQIKKYDKSSCSTTDIELINIKNKFNNQVDRNLKGAELEKQGKVDEAIELYELNVEEGFDGNHPYDSLANIYHKRKQYEDEIRVLEKGIKVFSEINNEHRRKEINSKINRFKMNLSEAIELYKKNS